MFEHLDATLTQLLNDAPVPELAELHNADVSFITPDRNFTPAPTTVDLFLYEVKENRELRDPRPIVERNGVGFRKHRAPLRADCSYIVTTWATSLQGDVRVATEHNLLGQALTWLSRFSEIPERYLQGLLGPPDLPIYPLPTTVAQQDPNQHAVDFWTAMGVAPRPAFYLTVTIELTLGGDQTGPLVTTWMSDFELDGDHERPWVGIGGRVVDQPAGDGVPDAVVDIVDLAVRTRTAAEGRYSFPRVPRGAHTVRVAAPGFQQQTQALVVPGTPDDYLVQLTPLP